MADAQDAGAGVGVKRAAEDALAVSPPRTGAGEERGNGELGSLTTLDDVLVSPPAKKSKLLDVEVQDADGSEEFPQVAGGEEDDEENLEDAELELAVADADADADADAEEQASNGAAAQRVPGVPGESREEEERKEEEEESDLGLEDLAPPPSGGEEDAQVSVEELEEEEEEDEEEDEEDEAPDSSAPASQEDQGDHIDIVDVDDDEDEENEENEEDDDETEDDGETRRAPASRSGDGSGGGDRVRADQQVDDEYDDEFDEDAQDEQEMNRALRHAVNKREARQLLAQLDDSARSKLCLMALEKYGEELFFGHESARDAILIDACAQDSILSLVRDANNVREMYARGTSAAPVELDDDEEDEEDDGGGEEDEEDDEEEDEDEDEEDSSAGHGKPLQRPTTAGTEEGEPIVLISDEDDENEDDENEDEDEQDDDDDENEEGEDRAAAADRHAAVDPVGDAIAPAASDAPAGEAGGK